MKYRQRDELVKGEGPWVSVDVTNSGAKARVKVEYYRERTTKDVCTTTNGTLDLGMLTPDQLSCVGRTIAITLSEMKQKQEAYFDRLVADVRRELP